MPDNPNSQGEKALTLPARDDENHFRNDVLKMTYMSTVRCHQPQQSTFDSSRSLESFFNANSKQSASKDQKFDDLLKQLQSVNPREAQPLQPRLSDVRADVPAEVKVKSEAEKFRDADPITKTSVVISRLPDFKMSFADKKLSVETDFSKMLEATPGIELGSDLKGIVGAAKKITLDGDRFTLDMNSVAKLKIDRDFPVVGKITDLRVGNGDKQLKFEVSNDPKTPGIVSLKNISGLSLERQGKEPLAVRELALDTSKDKPTIKVVIDNPLQKPSWMKDDFIKTVPLTFDLESVAPGLNADFLKGVVQTLSDSKSALLNRDAGMLLSGLPDEGIRTKLVDTLKGLQSIEKNGKQLTLVRDNGISEHDFGGPRLQVSPVIRCEIDTAGGGIDVKSVQGIKLVTALPPQAGLGKEFSVGLTGVSLSSKYGNDSFRSLTVSADKVVDSVRIKLNSSDLTPATDGNGNWRLDVHMTNPLDLEGRAKIFLPLKFDQTGAISNSTAEIASMASHVVKSGARANIANTVDAVDQQAAQLAGTAARIIQTNPRVAQAADVATTAARMAKNVVEEDLRQKKQLVGDVIDFLRR
ncbi:MAG TPA: hypothetical protein V6C89_01475 [Drouetiella sp.]|jgi:hypothetical protein